LDETFFDIESSPLDAEVNDVDDVIGINDGRAIVDAA
jgi:hypothetical protein